MADERPDETLLAEHRAGRTGALDALLARHLRPAYAYCLRLAGDPGEAEECAQQGLVRAFEKLEAFDGRSSFRTWLYAILTNQVRDTFRRRKRRRETAGVDEALAESLPDERAGAADGIEAGEARRAVEAAIAELPEKQRLVLLLHVYQGLPLPEIGPIVGCEYGAVKVNLCLARKRLRTLLPDYLRAECVRESTP